MPASPPDAPAGKVAPVNGSSAAPASAAPALPADKSAQAAKVCADVLELHQVRQDELAPICERRQAAGFAQEAADDVRKNLVGLALSGGGIRSASFNLGVLQAFYRSGLLRFVDYLSTVSGGGYIGSFLSSRVQALPATEKLYQDDGAATPDQPTVGCKLGLSTACDGTPPQAVKELMRSGQYLNRPLLFLNRYLIGLALNNIAFASLLIALCAGLALLWRHLDYIEIRWWVTDALAVTAKWIPAWSPINQETVLSLGGDVGVCFLPAAAFFGCWILCWCVVLIGRFVLLLTGIPFEWLSAFPVADAFHRALAKFIHKWMAATGWVTKILLFLSAACLLIGAAVLLGNSDIGQGTEGTFRHISNPVVSVLGALGLLGLLPILRPWRLIGSGHRPKSQVETFLFRLACTSILVGIPLCIVFLLARENVSGYATHSVDDILKWKDFAERIREDKLRWPAKPIWEELGRYEGNEPVYDVSAMEDVVQLNDQRAAADRIKTLQCFLKETDASPVFGNLKETKYTHVVKRRHLLLRAVNKVLSGPDPDDFVAHKQSDFSFVYLHDRFSGPANWVLSDRMLPYAALVNGYLWRGRSSEPAPPEGGRPQLQASASPLSDEQKTRLHDLREKYASLVSILITAKDSGASVTHFEKELGKLEFRRELGQLLLAEHYPDLVPAVKKSVKRVVVIDEDQKTRGNWFLIAGAIFLISIFFVNLNSTSLHGFYRDQLAETYLASGPNHHDVVLKDLAANTSKGAPYHVMAATLIQFPSLWKLLFNAQEPGVLSKLWTWLRAKLMKPADHGGARPPELKDSDVFVFSPLYCGSQVTGYQPTAEVRANMQNITLADAMAISGAAVTPLRVHNSLIRVLMVILNIRLGQWLPTPHRFCRTNWKSWVRWFGRWPSIPVLLANIAWTSDPRKRSLCFVTDGGHHENLGIWPLLQRRCRLVIVSDASQDNEHAFEDFLRLCRRSRLEAGISIVNFLDTDDSGTPFQLHPLRLHPDGIGPENSRFLRTLAARFSREHYILAQINYPDAEPGYLVYLKSSLTGDEENDLVGFSQANAEFPHDPTSNAMFDEDQVESYRQLGYHIADGLSRKLRLGLHVLPTETELARYRKFDIETIIRAFKRPAGRVLSESTPPSVKTSASATSDQKTDAAVSAGHNSVSSASSEFGQTVKDLQAGKSIPVPIVNQRLDAAAAEPEPHFSGGGKDSPPPASDGSVTYVPKRMEQIRDALKKCEDELRLLRSAAPEDVQKANDALQELRVALALGGSVPDIGTIAPQNKDSG